MSAPSVDSSLSLNLSSATCLSVFQRLDSRLSLLQGAVDEYNKAKNEFAVKVNLGNLDEMISVT